MVAFLQGMSFDRPLVVSWKNYSPTRSLSANALYWKWLSQMASHFTGRGYPLTKEDAHDLMRHQFLGYTEPRAIGRTEIPAALKSTSSLTVAEMCDYMTRVDAWAVGHGLFLVRPEYSEYERFLQRTA